MGAASTIGNIAKFIGKCLLAPVAVPLALLHVVVAGTAALALRGADICWSVIRQNVFSQKQVHDSFVKGIADGAEDLFFGGLRFLFSPYIYAAKGLDSGLNRVHQAQFNQLHETDLDDGKRTGLSNPDASQLMEHSRSNQYPR